MEMSSPEDFVEAYAKGSTRAGLEFTFDKIKELVINFRSKSTSFLDNPGIIKDVRKNYSSGEMKEYKKYVESKDLRRLISFGLTLRKITDTAKRTDFRNKIIAKHKTEGLHLVQFVENGLLNELIAFSNKDELVNEVNEVLKNIEKYVLFIQATDDCDLIIEKLKTKIHSSEPYIFIVSGMGPAVDLLKDCEKEIKVIMGDYKLKKISDDDTENLFFRKILD